MGFDSIWHWLLLLVIVLVVFGTGKLTKIGPDLGKAMRDFKKALRGDEDKDAQTPSAETLKADPPDPAPHDAESKSHESSQSK